MEEILEKYSLSTIKNINYNNLYQIIEFLIKEKCHYINDLLEDYLDLFTIEYEIFFDRYNQLNKKYNNNLLSLAAEDMNIFEEFFYN